MPFYRNLGPIRFQAEIQGFQIFSAEPETTIFQSREDQLPALEILVQFYASTLPADQVQHYKEKCKSQAIVISHCKAYQKHKLSIDEFCSVLQEIVKSTLRLSQILTEYRGGFSREQLKIVNGKVIFFYLPIIQKLSYDNPKLTIEGIINLGKQLSDENSMSHKLLLKKLAKCKNLHEVSEQIKYFSGVYGCGSRHGKFCVNLPVRQTARKCKLNLFKPQIKNITKGKSLHSSLHKSSRNSASFGLSMHYRPKNRRPTANSCSTRNNSIQIKTIDFNSSSVSLLKGRNEQKSNKSLKKKKINNCQSIHTPVSTADQQQLFKKLRKKTQNSSKNIEISSSQKQSIASSKIIKDISSKTIAQKMKQTFITQEYDQIGKFNEQNATMVKFPQQKEPINIQQLSDTRAIASKTILKHESVHHSQSKFPPPTINPNLQTVSAPPQKKMKKKPIVKEQDFGSQLEIVDLSKPAKENLKYIQDVKQIKNISKVPPLDQKNNLATLDLQECIQTRKNSYKNIGIENSKNEKVKAIIERRNILDFIGKAVVNTPGYLKNYESIFWELPLFFLYRSFYLERIKLSRMLQGSDNQQLFLELVKQNDQIGGAVTKMGKIVMKKLKKNDPELLKTLTFYLNTNQQIDCERPLKGLMQEYICSLQEALSSYPDLLVHQLEIVDSYLLCRGVQISIQTREKLKSKSSYQAYLKKQMTIMKNL